MKKLFLIGGVAVAALGFSACNGGKGSAPKSFEDSVSTMSGEYAGYSLARNIAGMPEDIRDKVSKEMFLKGLEVVLNADTATLNDYLSGMQFGMQQMSGFMQMYGANINIDRQAYLKAFAKAFMADSVSEAQMVEFTDRMAPVNEKISNIMMAEQQKKMAEYHKAQEEKFNKNKKAGEDFINKMKADKDVKVSESGLAYKVTKLGTGEVAKDTDRINVKYVGKTIDGKEFDSSNGEAVPFSPKGVVPGFGEALTTFPAGTEVTLYIPENLAYGRSGQGNIEPGSTLIFEMTIGEVVGQPAAAKDLPTPAAADKK